jgi:hypothetical protein
MSLKLKLQSATVFSNPRLERIKMLNLWIDHVFIIWKNTRKPGVVSLLVSNAYCVYMMGSIVNQIQRLGIEVLDIPGGCTYSCQPVNVEVNCPIKMEMMNNGRPGYLMEAEF